MFFINAIIFTSLVTAATSSIWAHCKDQPDTGVSVTDVKILGCTAPPCEIVKGTNATVIFTYTANQDFSKTTTSLCGYIYDKPDCVSFPLKENNECNQGAKCPIKKGDTETITQVLYIEKFFPDIKVIGKVTIEDPSNEVQGCFEVELYIHE